MDPTKMAVLISISPKNFHLTYYEEEQCIANIQVSSLSKIYFPAKYDFQTDIHTKDHSNLYIWLMYYTQLSLSMFLYISLFVIFFYGLFEENVHRLSVIYVTLYKTSFYFLQTLPWGSLQGTFIPFVVFQDPSQKDVRNCVLGWSLPTAFHLKVHLLENQDYKCTFIWTVNTQS